MGYKILGINLSHHGSACVLEDGEIIFFKEEERVTRQKYDTGPYYVLLEISKRYKIDEIAIGGINHHLNNSNYKKSILFVLEALFPHIPRNKHKLLTDKHHQTHAACAFYNSGFKEAISIIIDGSGSIFTKGGKSDENTDILEVESVFYLEYPNQIKTLYKNFRGISEHNNKVNIGKVWEAISIYLGFDWIEAGKTMGLSSYGKKDPSFMPIFIGNNCNPDLIKPGNLKDVKDILAPGNRIYPEKINIKDEDLAYQLQQESQELVGDMIESFLQIQNTKNVCASGGYFLNCVSNYYLKKRFPNINFYFEPISNDAGVAIGAAQMVWYDKTMDKTIRPQKSLYHSTLYSKEEILKKIQNYLD